MTLYAPEHEELRSTVRRLFGKSGDSAAVRAVIDGPELFDRQLWKRMAEELGLQGLAIAEDSGGSGFGVIELAVVLEEIGRVNLPSPYLSTVLAGYGLGLAGPGARAGAALAGIAEGSTVAAVHLDRPGSDRALDVADGGATGVCAHVLDGSAADVLVAQTSAGPALIDLRAPGVTVTRLETIDLTRGQARIDLEAAPVALLEVEDAETWAERMRAVALVLLAAEQIGGAQRCVEISTAYAAERFQFGRPIGSFQAVKHLCADMLIELELARAVAEHAIALADADTALPELSVAASTAKVACTQAFNQITADTIQVHGGIGYTWEHDAHLYFRRARAAAQLFGGLGEHCARIADRLGLGAAS